ncbi:aldehyde dehydrogenase family protein [Streptomyces rimosus]|uniref:aldehyde dehydrogenase family protein n=1 Tax=Streptomyces rimosus TaxID=1927 RepID=UPI001F230EC2|nr:aldehyde dehydrogenase family protein [Streptomyces rimosus]
MADATPTNGAVALNAAHAAQADWAAVPLRRRAGIVRRPHDFLLERVEKSALLITAEMGKSPADPGRRSATAPPGWLRKVRHLFVNGANLRVVLIKDDSCRTRPAKRCFMGGHER